MPCEVLAVYDTPDDTTLPYLEEYADKDPRLVPTLNTYGPGPACAPEATASTTPRPTIIVVTMADGSDDPQQVEPLAHLVERGVVVAAASRYVKGGQQVGGPFLKRIMSRLAGLSLYWFARVGTRDATNSFKAYDRDFVRKVGIESDAGFELGPRDGGQGPPPPPAGGRAAHHLARPHGRRIELPGLGLAAPLPAVVPLRLRAEVVMKVLVSGSSGFIGGYVVAGAARPRATRWSASTTTPSTARSPSPTTTTPTTASSRATPATSTS